MYIKLTLQEKLKDERTSRRMTLAKLEKATGISKATLGKYESDNCTDISPFNLAKLTEYYGLSMDYFMGLTEKYGKPSEQMIFINALKDDFLVFTTGYAKCYSINVEEAYKELSHHFK